MSDEIPERDPDPEEEDEDWLEPQSEEADLPAAADLLNDDGDEQAQQSPADAPIANKYASPG